MMNTVSSQPAAIVTGAGRGIGREIALRLARTGVSVALAARSRDEIAEVTEEVQAIGGVALAVTTDVGQRDEVDELVARSLDRFGRIDILVNNAAVNYVQSVIRSQDEPWLRTFQVNVFGAFYATRAVLRPMIRAKAGRIINIASVAGKTGVANNSAYVASKAALIGLTKAVALEVAKLGITVNAICPWHADTRMVREAMAARGAMFGESSEDYLRTVEKRNPQGRLTQIDEVADLAVYLASETARGINGQAINVCGGALTAG